MSKLFEMLQETGRESKRNNMKFASCSLQVYTDGTARVFIDNVVVAQGTDEAGIIAELSRRLVKPETAQV